MSILNDLGLKHGTDQSSAKHGYLDILEPYFAPKRMDAINLLEIGIGGGNSLHTWHEYFPLAVIFGIDHNRDYFEAVKGEGLWNLICGDSHKAETWTRVRDIMGGAVFDIIIDDGGHGSTVIIDTFGFGFPMLASGGLYVIEDLHHAYNTESCIGANKETPRSVRYFQEWLDYINEWGDGQTGKPSGSAPIKSLHFYKSLAIVERA